MPPSRLQTASWAIFPRARQAATAPASSASAVSSFEDLDKEKQAAKVLFTSKPLPNQAFSAGPKVKPEVRAKIVDALLSPEGLAASEKMREAFKAPKFEAASVEEYQGLGRLLRNEWGFEL